MDANTFATGAEFHPDAVYQLLVDTNNDNEPDVTFSAVFSEPQAGAQSVTLYRATGAEAGDMEPKGEVIIESSPVSFGSDVEVVEAGPFRFFAGRRSDPFFADVDGLLHNFQWTGADLFGDKDIFSIAMEMPNDVLGEQSEIGVWARINLRRNGDLVQVDRGGHPSLTAFFNSEDAKEEYNARQPAGDREHYLQPWSDVLGKAGYTGEEAARALMVVLPDVLHFDRSKPAAYPNGRGLTDDVFDARLALVTNGQVSGDQTGPHSDYLDTFPYRGQPHPALAAESATT